MIFVFFVQSKLWLSFLFVSIETLVFLETNVASIFVSRPKCPSALRVNVVVVRNAVGRRVGVGRCVVVSHLAAFGLAPPPPSPSWIVSVEDDGVVANVVLHRAQLLHSRRVGLTVDLT